MIYGHRMDEQCQMKGCVSCTFIVWSGVLTDVTYKDLAIQDLFEVAHFVVTVEDIASLGQTTS